MLNFIIRRTIYSVLILLGVVLLTFLLFNVAAGDPAAVALGKNARPYEIESLRKELGADLPLLFGLRCKTEAVPGYIQGKPLTPGVSINKATLELTPNFPEEHLLMVITDTKGRTHKQKVTPDTPLRFDKNTTQQIEFFRLQSNPFNSRFLRTLGEIIHLQSKFPYVKILDFGKTITTREPISAILCRGVWPSLCLMIPIFLGEMAVGIVLALLATAFKDTWIDRGLVLLSVAGISISYLVVIIFAQWFLGYYYQLFPVWGWEGWRSLGLPVLVGITCGVGGNVRFYRTVFSNELRKEYLRTATSKGASPLRIYVRHLLRNATIQIVTRASTTLPFLFTGSLLLESFFGIPGLGFAGIDALYNSDLQLLKALVVTSALLFVIINLLADLAYAWADPRIRIG